jgi:hypothetical protein
MKHCGKTTLRETGRGGVTGRDYPQQNQAAKPDWTGLGGDTQQNKAATLDCMVLD